MQKQQHLINYLQRRENALLQVARKIARIMGVKGDTHAMSIHAIHCALLDKSTALFEQNGDDTKFQQRLVEHSNRFGSITPYHPEFSAALRARVLQWPLQEVEIYMGELLTSNPPLCDKVGLDYLTDTLRDTMQVSARLERALLWLSNRKAEKLDPTSKTLGIELQAYEFSINEEVLRKIDDIATAIGLISEGQFILGDRKKSALTGFHQALREANWIKGTVPERNTFFGKRYFVVVSSDTYRGSKVGERYYRETTKILKQLDNVKLSSVLSPV